MSFLFFLRDERRQQSTSNPQSWQQRQETNRAQYQRLVTQFLEDQQARTRYTDSLGSNLARVAPSREGKKILYEEI